MREPKAPKGFVPRVGRLPSRGAVQRGNLMRGTSSMEKMNTDIIADFAPGGHQPKVKARSNQKPAIQVMRTKKEEAKDRKPPRVPNSKWINAIRLQ